MISHAHINGHEFVLHTFADKYDDERTVCVAYDLADRVLAVGDGPDALSESTR